MRLSDRIESLWFWVAIPLVRLTENSKHKYIRVLGLLGSFVLWPLVFISAPILLIMLIVFMFEDC